MAIITIATTQLFFFTLPVLFLIHSLASAKTTTGINFTDAVINNGTITKSSTSPNTGIKSGIRSIGLSK